MDVKEIKQFIEENKDNADVVELVNSFKVEPTLEVFKEKISTDPEFKSFMDSEKDKHHSKALDTWKTNNLDIIVDEKVKTLYPQDDPKDLEMKRLRQEMEDIKNNATRERMTNLALKKANELNIPTELVDFFVASDEDKTLENIERFSKTYTEGIQSTVKAKLEGNGDVVPKNDKFKTTKEEILEIEDGVERKKLIAENIELFN